jgi:hypothetical protein
VVNGRGDGKCYGCDGTGNVMESKASVAPSVRENESDLTLLGFAAIDLRQVSAGDIVIFRPTSLGHSRERPLRHGRTCKIVGFARNHQGDAQVTMRFKVAPELSDTDTSDGLTRPVDLTAARRVHDGFVDPPVARCAEAGRPWMASSSSRPCSAISGCTTVWSTVSHRPTESATLGAGRPGAPSSASVGSHAS